MITLRVKITEYNKERNVCTAELLNGDKIELDPFVSCAIPMDDDEYEAGKGFEFVGKEFILTEYTVYKQNVVPHENGMIEL
jgi:hypothetical protein